VWVKGRRCLYSEGTTTPRILNPKDAAKKFIKEAQTDQTQSWPESDRNGWGAELQAIASVSISDYAIRAWRAPALLLALAYARVGGISLDVLADDELSLD